MNRRSFIAALLPTLALLPLLPGVAAAGPRGAVLLARAEDYLKAVKRAEGTLTLTGPGADDLRAWLGLPAAATTTTAPPLRLPFSLERDKLLQLGDTPQGALPFKDLKLRRTPTAARALALALAAGRLKRAATSLGTNLPAALITLDRIEGRFVWAVGNADMAVWVDRELLRPVRFQLGPGALDSHTWAIRLRYDDQGASRGWFPTTAILDRGDHKDWLTATIETTAPGSGL